MRVTKDSGGSGPNFFERKEDKYKKLIKYEEEILYYEFFWSPPELHFHVMGKEKLWHNSWWLSGKIVIYVVI